MNCIDDCMEDGKQKHENNYDFIFRYDGGTMFLSFGNVFTFGGLLVTLPDEKTFENFRRKRMENNVNE